MSRAKEAFKTISEALNECDCWLQFEDGNECHVSDIGLETKTRDEYGESEYEPCFDIVKEELDKHEKLKSNVRELFKEWGLEITDSGVAMNTRGYVSSKENIELLRKILEVVEE